jgi:hypothetical protein
MRCDPSVACSSRTRSFDIEPKTSSSVSFVACINNTGYPVSLERHEIYRVLPDEGAAADGDIRLINESGEDYVYPAAYFVPIDSPT